MILWQLHSSAILLLAGHEKGRCSWVFNYKISYQKLKFTNCYKTHLFASLLPLVEKELDTLIKNLGNKGSLQESRTEKQQNQIKMLFMDSVSWIQNY